MAGLLCAQRQRRRLRVAIIKPALSHLSSICARSPATVCLPFHQMANSSATGWMLRLASMAGACGYQDQRTLVLLSLAVDRWLEDNAALAEDHSSCRGEASAG